MFYISVNHIGTATIFDFHTDDHITTEIKGGHVTISISPITIYPKSTDPLPDNPLPDKALSLGMEGLPAMGDGGWMWTK